MPITVENCKSGILTTDISDHFFVFGIFNNLKVKPLVNQIKKREFSQKNVSKFNKVLITSNWYNIYSLLNTQDAFSNFYITFTECFNSCFPEVTVKINYKNRNTWMSKSLIKCIEKNHKLYELSIAQPTDINIKLYKDYKINLHQLKEKLREITTAKNWK